MDIADALTDTFVPTLMSLARSQAYATFGGHYRHASLLNATASPPYGNTSTSPASPPYANGTASHYPQPLNSSLTITVDPTGEKPGLGVEGWISNGTDMARIAVALNSNVRQEYLDEMQPSVRLYPTGLEEERADGGLKRVAFKAVFEDLGLPERSSSYVTDCSTWVGLTGVVYGSRPLDQFVFELGEDGTAVAVENGALRVRLVKVPG
jgi:hypothetical protein